MLIQVNNEYGQRSKTLYDNSIRHILRFILQTLPPDNDAYLMLILTAIIQIKRKNYISKAIVTKNQTWTIIDYDRINAR